MHIILHNYPYSIAFKDIIDFSEIYIVLKTSFHFEF